MSLILDPAVIEEIAKEDPEYAAQLAREYRKAMIVLARKDPSWFCAYVLKNEQNGAQIFQTPEHEAVHRNILECSRTIVWTYPSFGKALPLDTPVPTPSGWRTMGDLAAGDLVYSSTGAICAVTDTTPTQHGRTVYRIVFDDHTSVLADADHNWLATNTVDRHQHRNCRVVTTQQMAAGPLVRHGKTVWAIPLAGAVQYPERDLPIHPYVLGAWLGDGDSKRPWLTFHGDDRAVYDRCVALEGGPEAPQPILGREHLFRGCIGGKDFWRRLKALGVTGRSGSKFIPPEYLLGSEEQRRELLMGLLDTDGWISETAGMVEFSNMQQCLADGVAELARSLGMKVAQCTKEVKLYGRYVGTAYIVRFNPETPVFYLTRKLARQKPPAERTGRARWRYIVAITPVESVPVRCIAVDSPDHSFLFGKDYTVTHNCEKRNNRILCADGTWAKVQDLTEPTKLLTWDERTGKLTEVTGQAHDNGPKHTLAIELSNGAVLNVTENHPIRAADLSWVRADQLKVGQHVIALGHLDLQDGQTVQAMPDDEAEILGYLLAGRVWRNESVVVRNINKSDHWSARRLALFERAGWILAPYKKHSFVVTATDKAAMTPAMFLASLTTIERGWPVDLKSEVWRLPTASIQRLLSGFFACAYFSPDGGRKSTGCPIGGTYGLGDHRVPAYVGHPYQPVLETVRKLLLRCGVTANIRPWVAHKRLGRQGYGGIWKGSTRSYDRRFQILSVPNGQVEFFWPTAKQRNKPSLLCMVTVTAITRSAVPVQTYGIEVQEHQHSYISEGVLVHNTNQISIGHVLWRIGKDPNTTIAIMCNTSEMATRIVSSIKGYIAYSPEFKDVFPDIKPGEIWASNKFSVVRESLRKDPTVQAVGLTGNIVGARLDGLVIDDIDNIDSTLTEAARVQTEQRVRKQGISRLSADGWAVGIGNVWHEKDCLHRLAASGWRTLRYPVLVPSKDEPGELVSANPEMFPMERIYQIRDFDQGPIEFERLYMLKARIDGEQRFKVEWIERALELGKQQILLRDGLPKIPSGCRTVTGVDLGVKPKSKNDPTVITTVLEVPKGDKQYDFQILNIVKGRWNAQEIMDKIKEQQRFFASEVWVESNGCFIPGTRILTPEGYKPIETVVPGDLVWTHMGRWRKVLERYDGTARHVTPIRARGNLAVTCTPNHAFYARRAGRTPGRGGGHHRPVDPKGWCSAGFPDVPLYLNIAVPQWPDAAPVLHLAATQKLPERTLEVDESLALVLGLFMAEGHSTGAQVFWTFNKTESYLADLLDRVLVPLGFKLTRRFGNGTLRVYLTQKQLGAVLKIGTGTNKCLPLSWLGWPLPLRLALVRGWLLGDGSIGKNGDRRKLSSRHLCGSTISRHWALFVRTTLHQAGIPTAIQEKAARKSAIAGRVLHTNPQFCISLSQKGSETLRSYMADPSESTRWSSAWWGQPLPSSKVVDSSLVLQHDGAWARQAAFSPEPSETFVPYENGPVHNLVVEEDHSFTAEDYVVHNAQDFLIQLMNMSGMSYKVNAFRTGMNKYDPMFGVEAIAAEMAMGRWWLPSWDGTREGCEEEVDELIEEMLAYQPNNHTGDLLMSLWIARDGARQSRQKIAGKVEFGRLNLRRR